MHTSNTTAEISAKTKSYNENLILFILASIQFTYIMDFVIMMPMNPIFQEVFSIDNKQFGLLVSAYALSAGASGFISFFFIDRLDRKTALLLFYSGFALGTVGCAIAGNYYFFLIARIVAGAFGGVLGALVLAIIGDIFHESKRGRATGIVMASFSVASIAGIPTGLYLASKFSWHIPFFLIAGLSIVIILLSINTFPSIKEHIQSSKQRVPLDLLKWMFTSPIPLWTLLFYCFLMLAGYCIIPYISDYLVSNVGFVQDDLKYVYLIGGLATVITSPLIGKLADKFGKRKVFIIVGVLSLLPIVLITNLSVTPKAIVFVVTGSFFIAFNGRFVTAMAMITSSVERSKRGGFMSISSSFQQLSSALATFIGGVLIGEKVNGQMVNYWQVGIFAVVMTLLCILTSFKVKQVD